MKHTNGLLRFAALLMTAVVLLSMIPALSASAADRTFKEKEIPAYYFSMKNTDKPSAAFSAEIKAMMDDPKNAGAAAAPASCST